MSDQINIADIPVEDMVKHLSTQNYIVRSEDQDNEYWQKKQVDVVGGKLKEWSENLEGKIASLTSVERNGSEKSLDFLERAIGSINEKYTGTVGELESLRETTSKGEGAASEIQKQFDAFKKAKEKEIQDLSGKVGNMEGLQFKNRVDLSVNEAMSKIRPTLKQDKENNKLIESAIQNEINNFYNSVKAVDHQGGLIFHDADDNPLIDKTNGNHLGALEILKDRLSYLVDEARVVGGTGADGKFVPKDGDGKYKLQLPAEIDSKVKLTDYLVREKSLDPNDPEFNKYFKENGSGLKLR